MSELLPRSRLPNILTASRVPLAVGVYVLMLRGSFVAALGLLILAQVTDWVDGALARRWRAQSQFGTVVEHVADSLLVVLASLALAQVGALPVWVLVVGCVYCGLSWITPQRIRRVWVLNAVLGMRSLLYGFALAVIPFLILGMIADRHPLLATGIAVGLVFYGIGTIYWKRGRIQYYVLGFLRRLPGSMAR